MPLIRQKQILTAGALDVSLQAPPAATLVRVCALVLSGILLLYFLWQLAIQLLGPEAPNFLDGSVPASSSSIDEAAFSSAAAIAGIRGDLWLDAALIRASREEFHPGANSSSALANSRADVLRSLRWAPHDARAWLLLSVLESKPDENSRSAVEALKMSYYTGPGNLSLVAWRMKLALQRPALDDPEVRSLAAGEIEGIIRYPPLLALVAAAYRDASPQGKRFIENVAGPLSAEGLAKIKAAREINK
jgi:hypothetical protein